jgi:hypothetical protein
LNDVDKLGEPELGKRAERRFAGREMDVERGEDCAGRW